MATLDDLIIHGTGRLIAFGTHTASITVAQTVGLRGDVPVPKVGQTFTITVAGSTVPTITITKVTSAVKVGSAYSYHFETSAITGNWPTGSTGAEIRFDDFVERTRARTPLRLTVNQTASISITNFQAYGSAKKLTYTAVSTFTPAQASISVAGADVTITGHSLGKGTLTLTASNGTQSASDAVPMEFRATPRAPTLVHSFAPVTLVESQTTQLDLDAAHHFSDPDGDTLTISVHIPDDAPFSVTQTQGLIFRIALDTANAPLGTWNITYTATDPDHLTATAKQAVTVTANRAPTIARRLLPISAAIPPPTRYSTGSASDHFSDADGDTLTYSAAIADAHIASVQPPFSGDTLVMQIQRWIAQADFEVSVWTAPAGFDQSKLVGVGVSNTPSGVTEIKIETGITGRPTTDNSNVPDFDGALVGGYAVQSATIDWSDSSGITEAVVITLTLTTPTTAILTHGDSISVNWIPIPLPANGAYRILGHAYGKTTLRLVARDAHTAGDQTTIISASHVPTWTSIPDQTLEAGTVASVDLDSYYADADGAQDFLRYTVDTPPVGMRARILGNLLYLTGLVSSATAYTVRVYGEDRTGFAEPVDVSVTVNAPPAPTRRRAPILTRMRAHDMIARRGEHIQLVTDGTSYDLLGVYTAATPVLSQVFAGAIAGEYALNTDNAMITVSEIELQKLSAEHRTLLLPSVVNASALAGQDSGQFHVRGADWIIRASQLRHDADSTLTYSFALERVEVAAPDANGNGVQPAPTPATPDWTLRRDFVRQWGGRLAFGRSDLDDDADWTISNWDSVGYVHFHTTTLRDNFGGQFTMPSEPRVTWNGIGDSIIYGAYDTVNTSARVARVTMAISSFSATAAQPPHAAINAWGINRRILRSTGDQDMIVVTFQDSSGAEIELTVANA